jgi:hypothetical protein
MNRALKLVFVLSLATVAVGCATGTQPVIWAQAQPIDFQQSFRLELGTEVPVPPSELALLDMTIHRELSQVFRGGAHPAAPYRVRVVIKKYDPGNAAARFFWGPAGEMTMDGVVQVIAGQPPTYVRVGEFRKKYNIGGLVGAMASMDGQIAGRVGSAIAEALVAPVVAATR